MIEKIKQPESAHSGEVNPIGVYFDPDGNLSFKGVLYDFHIRAEIYHLNFGYDTGQLAVHFIQKDDETISTVYFELEELVRGFIERIHDTCSVEERMESFGAALSEVNKVADLLILEFKAAIEENKK